MTAHEKEAIQTPFETFLIAEYQAVLERSLKFEEVKANRINFYLILLGAVLAGFAAVVDTPFIQLNIFPFSIAVALFLLILGWQTLMHSVQYSMVITSLYRVSGRARRWFFDKDNSIVPYLAFEPADNKPGLKIGSLKTNKTNWGVQSLLWRGGEPILMTTNAILASLIIGLALMWGLSISSLSFQEISAIVAIFLPIGIAICWQLQAYRIKAILDKRHAGLKSREFFEMTKEEYISLVDQYTKKKGK